jgi:DNA (cytosine-5)-methyltransferase 1
MTTILNSTPYEIRAARKAAGLTQAQAGALVHSDGRTWRRWEAGERAMHPAFFELFRLKVDLYQVNNLN